MSTYIDTVLSDMESASYACWAFNIPACAFDAPHRRERIFIVAHAERERRCSGTQQGNMQRMLGNHPSVRAQGSGTLNPTWVEWLMGFPIAFTDLEA